MNELLQAAIRTLNSVSALAEYALVQEKAKNGGSPEVAPAEAPKKERKARSAAAATKAEAKVAEPGAAGTGVDAEKVKADTMAITRTFVTSHANQEEGKKKALAIIAKEFNGCNGMSALLALPVGEQERYISIIDEKLRALNGAAREEQLA